MIKAGDLIFLTQDYENYVYEHNLRMTIPTERRPAGIRLVNRLAKIEEIIDWDTPKGQKILELRKKSGKWEGLSMMDCKYIISVYYHDLTGRNGEKGVAERGQPIFDKDPVTGAPFFVVVPDWILKEILKKCETFNIQDR
jgi:hypothetical protein